MQAEVVKRRFTISDAFILIAATAVGFALVRQALNVLKSSPIQLMGGYAEYAIFYSLLYGTPVLIACSIALVGLSLRQPRPPLRRLVRSPGFVVNAAALSGVFVVLLHYIGQTMIDPSRASGTYIHVLSTGLPGDVGYFVMGSFLPLILRGHLRPRPIWTDWLGYLVGLLWIVMSLMTWARLYVILWR